MFEIVAERICEMMVILLILWPMHLEFTMAFTIFVGTACPMAAATILFAQRYDGDARYATEAVRGDHRPVRCDHPPAVHPGHMAAAVMRLDSSQIS